MRALRFLKKKEKKKKAEENEITPRRHKLVYHSLRSGREFDERRHERKGSVWQGWSRPLQFGRWLAIEAVCGQRLRRPTSRRQNTLESTANRVQRCQAP